MTMSARIVDDPNVVIRPEFAVPILSMKWHRPALGAGLRPPDIGSSVNPRMEKCTVIVTFFPPGDCEVEPADPRKRVPAPEEHRRTPWLVRRGPTKARVQGFIAQETRRLAFARRQKSIGIIALFIILVARVLPN
jgi:hypothetical protein